MAHAQRLKEGDESKEKSAAAHTFGQDSFSHMSFGQRTEHSGCSQWTVHLAHSVYRREGRSAREAQGTWGVRCHLLALHFTFRAGAHRVANSRARRVITLPAAHRVAVLLLKATRGRVSGEPQRQVAGRRQHGTLEALSASVSTAATTMAVNTTGKRGGSAKAKESKSEQRAGQRTKSQDRDDDRRTHWVRVKRCRNKQRVRSKHAGTTVRLAASTLKEI
jgi:hypothetical protein